MNFSLRFLIAVTAIAIVEIGASPCLIAQDESLPEPSRSSVLENVRQPLTDNSSLRGYRRGMSDAEATSKAIRMEQSRYMSWARQDLLVAQMYAGYQPARPTVNAGYMFNAPPRISYRWINMYQPIYPAINSN